MESELAVRSGVSFHDVSFISPDTSVPKQVGRHTREAYVDPKTNLIYVTDGNGGGVTVLRYTGPMPQRPPIPGAR